MKYYKCECGSESFIKRYNVWNVEFKVEVTECNTPENESDEDYWDIRDVGVVKDHLDGYYCKECGKLAQELCDGL